MGWFDSDDTKINNKIERLTSSYADSFASFEGDIRAISEYMPQATGPFRKSAAQKLFLRLEEAVKDSMHDRMADIIQTIMTAEKSEDTAGQFCNLIPTLCQKRLGSLPNFLTPVLAGFENNPALKNKVINKTCGLFPFIAENSPDVFKSVVQALLKSTKNDQDNGELRGVIMLRTCDVIPALLQKNAQVTVELIENMLGVDTDNQELFEAGKLNRPVVSTALELLPFLATSQSNDLLLRMAKTLLYVAQTDKMVSPLKQDTAAINENTFDAKETTINKCCELMDILSINDPATARQLTSLMLGSLKMSDTDLKSTIIQKSTQSLFAMSTHASAGQVQQGVELFQELMPATAGNKELRPALVITACTLLPGLATRSNNVALMPMVRNILNVGLSDKTLLPQVVNAVCNVLPTLAQNNTPEDIFSLSQQLLSLTVLDKTLNPLAVSAAAGVFPSLVTKNKDIALQLLQTVTFSAATDAGLSKTITEKIRDGLPTIARADSSLAMNIFDTLMNGTQDQDLKKSIVKKSVSCFEDVASTGGSDRLDTVINRLSAKISGDPDLQSAFIEEAARFVSKSNTYASTLGKMKAFGQEDATLRQLFVDKMMEELPTITSSSNFDKIKAVFSALVVTTEETPENQKRLQEAIGASIPKIITNHSSSGLYYALGTLLDRADSVAENRAIALEKIQTYVPKLYALKSENGDAFIKEKLLKKAAAAPLDAKKAYAATLSALSGTVNTSSQAFGVVTYVQESYKSVEGDPVAQSTVLESACDLMFSLAKNAPGKSYNLFNVIAREAFPSGDGTLSCIFADVAHDSRTSDMKPTLLLKPEDRVFRYKEKDSEKESLLTGQFNQKVTNKEYKWAEDSSSTGAKMARQQIAFMQQRFVTDEKPLSLKEFVHAVVAEKKRLKPVEWPALG